MCSGPVKSSMFHHTSVSNRSVVKLETRDGRGGVRDVTAGQRFETRVLRINPASKYGSHETGLFPLTDESLCIGRVPREAVARKPAWRQDPERPPAPKCSPPPPRSGDPAALSLPLQDGVAVVPVFVVDLHALDLLLVLWPPKEWEAGVPEGHHGHAGPPYRQEETQGRARNKTPTRAPNHSIHWDSTKPVQEKTKESDLGVAIRKEVPAPCPPHASLYSLVGATRAIAQRGAGPGRRARAQEGPIKKPPVIYLRESGDQRPVRGKQKTRSRTRGPGHSVLLRTVRSRMLEI
jgi:hypothetical protein